MRIAVYKDNLATGRGADRAVRNFAEGLSSLGHEAILFEKKDLSFRLGQKWDAVVATGSNEAVDLDAAGYFDRADRAPVVLQLHLAPRGFFKWKHPIRNWRIRRAFDRVDVAQVLCSSYVGEFRELASHPRVEVIGNYTEMEDVAAGPPSDRHMILCPAATVNKIKNQKLLLRAFARVAGEFPGWTVRLLGKMSTKYAQSCRLTAERLGVTDRVTFVGFTDDLKGEYLSAAFVAFPSRLEGFPLAILEAAHFGLPVVAQKDLPGVTDIVPESAGVVTENSVEAYAAGLRRLMADAEFCRSMGECARQFCAERYARETILNRWEILLRQVASTR
jgi:glycosyltransferase involved in cell wall biosynthesis